MGPTEEELEVAGAAEAPGAQWVGGLAAVDATFAGVAGDIGTLSRRTPTEPG